MNIDRDVYLQQCKKRALEFLDRGDVVNAIASMGSELRQHPDFTGIVDQLMVLGLKIAIDRDPVEARRFIVGFR